MSQMLRNRFTPARALSLLTPLKDRRALVWLEWTVRPLLTLALLAFPLSAMADSAPSRVRDLAWLAGVWEGAPNDQSGAALSVFTEPTDGSMAWWFRWSVPADGHVHYAHTVYQDSEGGVIARGIHRGRQFDTFEETHWTFELETAREGLAVFRCVSECRASAITLRLLDDGRLEENYTSLEGKADHWVVRYRRTALEP